MGFAWSVKTINEEKGLRGSVATAGAFQLMVMPVRSAESDPETAGLDEVVGYSFKVVGMQGGGTDFMAISPTMEEAQQRAEFTYTALLFAGLSVVDKELLDAFLKNVKIVLQPTLDEAVEMAIALRDRNIALGQAIAEREKKEEK
jgi:hypothetical protein